jgi:hypothetical protein
VPLDWEYAVAAIAHVLHWSRAELLDLDIDEFTCWLDKALWITNSKKGLP